MPNHRRDASHRFPTARRTRRFGRAPTSPVTFRQWVGLAVVGLVTAIGALWFWLVEGFGFVDALYQSVITISTVGFSEVQPLDTSGRLFTVVLILFGVSAMVYALGGFAEMLIASSIRRFSSRRKERTLDRLADHTIVCGYGRTGEAVAEMMPTDTEVGIIEANSERADVASQAGWVVLEADCTQDSTLEAAGIERAARIIICLSTDSDAISTVLSARVLNPAIHIVSRVNAIDAVRKLRLAGADHVVSPLRMGAQRMVADAMEPTIGSFIDAALSDTSIGLSIRAFPVPVAISRNRLTELERATQVRVVGLQNSTGTIVDPGASITAGQLCVVVGHEAELRSFEASLAQLRDPGTSE